MNTLMDTLHHIADECKDDAEKNKKKQEEKDMDDFTKLKKKISRDLKEVRERIQERNELLGKMDNNTTTVRMSSDIRSRLKGIQKDAEELQTIQQTQQTKLEKKKAKGKQVAPDLEREVEYRAQIVELSFKHIEECKNLERAGYKGGAMVDDSDAPKPTITSLPDIDNDDFKELRNQDKIIDQKLEKVQEGVKILGEMANQFGREIEMQEILIAENNKQADKTNAQLENLNSRLKKTLNGIRSCDRFVLDFVLIVVVLALILYIYNMVA